MKNMYGKFKVNIGSNNALVLEVEPKRTHLTFVQCNAQNNEENICKISIRGA